MDQHQSFLKIKIGEWRDRIVTLLPLEIEEIAKNSEEFTIKLTSSGIKLTYPNERIGLFALKKLYTALQMQDQNIIGIHRPKTDLRAILPEFFQLSDSFLLQIIELGYNGIVLEKEQQAFAAKAKDYQLKVILKAELKPEKFPFEDNYEGFVTEWIKSLPPCEGLFLESSYFQHDCRKQLLKFGKLKAELHLKELNSLEQHIQLFYKIPQYHADLFKELQSVKGSKTYLVFSAFEGGLDHDFAADSPYWNLVDEKSIPQIKGTIAEEIPFVLLQRITRFFQKKLDGAIIQIPAHLKPFDLCNLSLISDAFWSDLRPEESFLQWLKVNQPELDPYKTKEYQEQFAKLLSNYSYFKAVLQGEITPEVENIKVILDLFIAECKILQKLLEREEKSDKKFFSFIEELNLGLESLLSLTKEALARYQIPIPHYLNSIK